MVSFCLGEDHKQKSKLEGEYGGGRIGWEGRTVDAVGDEGLAVRVLVFGGGVALVVADLVATLASVRLNLVRLWM